MNTWDELYSKGAKYIPVNEIYLRKLLKKIERLSKKNRPPYLTWDVAPETR